MKLFEPLRDVQYRNIMKYGLIYSMLFLLITFGGRIIYYFFDNYMDVWIEHGYSTMKSKLKYDFTDMNKWFLRRLFFPAHLRYFIILTTGVFGFIVATIQYCFLRHKKVRVLDIQ